MIQGFDFIDNERTFTCSAEKTHALGDEVWWWFSVSTDDRQRYAPFRASSSDTQKSVKARIVAFYDDLLVRRATPTVPAWRRGPQGAPEAEAPKAAEPAAAKPAQKTAAKPAAKGSGSKPAATKPAARKPSAPAKKPVKARSK